MHLEDIQKDIYEIYIHHDRRRGIDKTLEWFLTEVYELYIAIKYGGDIGEEASDVIAWLLSLCNLYGINIEIEFKRKYGNKCPKCDSKPCTCEYRPEPNKKVVIVRIQ
ncbi:TPA: nucleotide pyrophosphohydrolase [Candidatus Geothermarchaeota archaeon]|nr:nucleotide pyrophosphohydrolase [Candidatus Geothermarchaeota archaeon]HIQ13255.1 nucleotide pyrophosphohydrolase [Thermoprotei archaeon]